MDDLLSHIPVSLDEWHVLWDSVSWIFEAAGYVIAALVFLSGATRYIRSTIIPLTRFGFHFARIKVLVDQLDTVIKAHHRYYAHPDRIAAFAGGLAVQAITMVGVICCVGFSVEDTTIRAALCATTLGILLNWFSKPLMVLRYLSNPERFLDTAIDALRRTANHLAAAGRSQRELEAVWPLIEKLKAHTDQLGKPAIAHHVPASPPDTPAA